MAQFLWVIFPYLCLAVLITGSLFRYAYGQLGWSARSSQLLEGRLLRWGSPLFHWGILFVLGGHVMGLLVPLSVYSALGIPPELYHQVADLTGGVAGLAALAGLAILLYRRLRVPSVRRTTSVADWVALLSLFVVVLSGDAITVGYNNIVGPYEYRATVGPWVRGLLGLHPLPSLMASTPVLFQVHIALAFLLLGIWPFTRLVHAFSVPLAYPRRAPIQYRLRHPRRQAGGQAERGWVEGAATDTRAAAPGLAHGRRRPPAPPSRRARR